MFPLPLQNHFFVALHITTAVGSCIPQYLKRGEENIEEEKVEEEEYGEDKKGENKEDEKEEEESKKEIYMYI